MDNIINFKPKDAHLPIKKKEGYCTHKSVEVDEDERDIRCVSCNARIDPFDYIWKMAIKERNVLFIIADLEKKQKQELEKLEELEKQVRNLKSQKNRLLKL